MSIGPLTLTRPRADLRDSFLEAVREYQAEGRYADFGVAALAVPTAFADFVAALRAKADAGAVRPRRHRRARRQGHAAAMFHALPVAHDRSLQWHLRRAPELARILDDSSIHDFSVDATHEPADSVAAAIARTLAWR